jgi:hypothetical protein
MLSVVRHSLVAILTDPGTPRLITYRENTCYIPSKSLPNKGVPARQTNQHFSLIMRAVHLHLTPVPNDTLTHDTQPPWILGRTFCSSENPSECARGIAASTCDMHMSYQHCYQPSQRRSDVNLLPRFLHYHIELCTHVRSRRVPVPTYNPPKKLQAPETNFSREALVFVNRTLDKFVARAA